MARAPILPTNHDDPNGTGAKVRQANDEFKRRIRKCRDAYLAVLDGIHFSSYTVNVKRYEFLTLPDVLARSLDTAADLVDQFLGADDVRSWWTLQYVIPAYEKGAAAAWRNLGVQSTEYQLMRPSLQSLLTSEPYQRRIGLISAREFELMKGLSSDVKQGLSQQLTAGLAQGIGPKEIARNITLQTGIEERRAERLARTEVNQALRTARMDETTDAAQRLGVNVRVLHISALSPTTRATHAARHGNLYTVEAERDWFAESGQAVNCFLPGTRVRGRFVGGSKTFYDGQVVEVVTMSGNKFTVTPNHPLLTDSGRLCAGQLRKGDYLVSNRLDVKDPVGPLALDGKLADARIEDVFGSLSEVGHTGFRRVSAVDFHGDGKFGKENIEIVSSERVLAYGNEAELPEFLDKLYLKHADAPLRQRERPFDLRLVGVGLPPSSDMGFLDQSRPAFSAFSLHAQESSLRPSALLQSEIVEPSGNLDTRHADISRDFLDRLAVEVSGVERRDIESSNELVIARTEADLGEPYVQRTTADANFSRQALEAFPGFAALDEVVEVNVLPFAGHVYDLEEVSGGMIAENITFWNCKCSTSEVLVDDEGKPLSPGLIARLDRSREAWQARNEKAE